MRSVSKRLGVIALLLFLSTQSVLAAPMDREHSWRERVRHLIVTIFDQLGVPGP